MGENINNIHDKDYPDSIKKIISLTCIKPAEIEKILRENGRIS